MNTINKELNLDAIYGLCCGTAFFRNEWVSDTRLSEVDESWDEDDENSRPDLSAWEHIVQTANDYAEWVGVPPTIDARCVVESLGFPEESDVVEEYLARLEEDLEEKGAE